MITVLVYGFSIIYHSHITQDGVRCEHRD
jgi:hypothetical protein